MLGEGQGACKACPFVQCSAPGEPPLSGIVIKDDQAARAASRGCAFLVLAQEQGREPLPQYRAAAQGTQFAPVGTRDLLGQLTGLEGEGAEMGVHDVNLVPGRQALPQVVIPREPAAPQRVEIDQSVEFRAPEGAFLLERRELGAVHAALKEPAAERVGQPRVGDLTQGIAGDRPSGQPRYLRMGREDSRDDRERVRIERLARREVAGDIAVRPDDRYAETANASSVALAPANTVVVTRYSPSISSIPTVAGVGVLSGLPAQDVLARHLS